MRQKENLFTPDCIRTFTGQYVKVIDPDPETLSIVDIAYALSNQYRFGGHLPVPYSVAQHCVMCSRYTAGDKFEALMHDATEAYLLDIPSPIKKHLPDYQNLEDQLAKALSEKFGFGYPFSAATKDVDLLMLQMEWESFMVKSHTPFIEIWDPAQARSEFLKIFYEYK